MAKARPAATWVARPRSLERRVHEEADHADHGQHEPAREALEHDRRERLGRLARVARQAADPQHVAADRGGQHVGHELPGQVVATAGGAGRRGARAPRAPAATAPPRARRPTSVSSHRHGEPERPCGRQLGDDLVERRSAGCARPGSRASARSRPMRSTERHGLLPVHRPLSPSLERSINRRPPTAGPTSSVRCARQAARREARPVRPAPTTTITHPWEGPCSASSLRCWSRRCSSSAACATEADGDAGRGSAPATRPSPRCAPPRTPPPTPAPPRSRWSWR